MSMTQGSFAEVLLLELECNRDSPAPESRQEDGIHATGMAPVKPQCGIAILA